MASVKVSDILTPEIWNRYGQQKTAAKSAFWQAGAVRAVQGIDMPRGGGAINIPFFGDLTGDAEVLSDTGSLTVNGIASSKQVAVICGRGVAFGVNDLAAVFAGDDPATAILDSLAAYWAREMQKELLATLAGVFASASMSGNVHDISAFSGSAAVISAATLIDAQFKLGDAFDKLAAVAMHSATYQKLLKDDLIAFIKPSDGTTNVPTYLGKRVIVDDSLPVSSGVYTTYLFGTGSVAYAEGVIGNGPMETDRDILAADTVVTMRRRFILHVLGTKWVGTPAGLYPERPELATGTNWVRVFENKNIPVVQFKHKLA